MGIKLTTKHFIKVDRGCCQKDEYGEIGIAAFGLFVAMTAYSSTTGGDGRVSRRGLEKIRCQWPDLDVDSALESLLSAGFITQEAEGQYVITDFASCQVTAEEDERKREIARLAGQASAQKRAATSG